MSSSRFELTNIRMWALRRVHTGQLNHEMPATVRRGWCFGASRLCERNLAGKLWLAFRGLIAPCEPALTLACMTVMAKLINWRKAWKVRTRLTNLENNRSLDLDGRCSECIVVA